MAEEENGQGISPQQIIDMVQRHEKMLSGISNERRVKGAMRRAYGSASDEDKASLPKMLDYLSGKNRDYFKERGFSADDADDNFDEEFQQTAMRAIEQGANPMAAVMGMARQLGYKPQEAQQAAADATQGAVEQKQAEAEGGQEGGDTTGAEEALQAGDMPEAAADMTQAQADKAAAPGGAIEAAMKTQRPQASGVSVKKGWDDYDPDELEEMSRKDPGKYAKLLNGK